MHKLDEQDAHDLNKYGWSYFMLDVFGMGTIIGIIIVFHAVATPFGIFSIGLELITTSYFLVILLKAHYQVKHQQSN